MNNYPKLVVDIETIPNESMTNMLPEPKVVLGNLKDPEKIQAKRDAAKKEQVSKMALSPLWGKIACIGLYWPERDEKTFLVGDETENIGAFLRFRVGHQLVTYNGKGFDLPYIFKRGIIGGVEGCSIPAMNGYTDRFKSNAYHIDVMQEFCEWGKYEKLDTLARVMLGEEKLEHDHTKTAEMLKTNDGIIQLTNYCGQDLDLTWKLAKKMGVV